MRKEHYILNRQPIFQFLLAQQIFFFFIGAFGGFLWEVVLYLIQDGTFVKRGFFHGPWLPIYGTGAVTFYLLLSMFRLFFQTLFIGTGIELSLGFMLDTFWGLRYWTYEGTPFNFHGYICLSSSICFGIAGVLWVGFLADFVTRLWLKIPEKIRVEINTILVLLFLLDCVTALLFPNMGNSITF